MAYLGTPYRVLYEAKNLKSGLTDGKAFVVKAENSVAGLFSLSEYSFQSLAGLYYFDLITSLFDVEGEWTVMVLSPSEGIRYPYKISFQRNPLPEIGVLISNFIANGIITEPQGLVDLKHELTKFIETSMELTGYVLPDEATSQIESLELNGSADIAPEIKGDIDHGV